VENRKLHPFAIVTLPDGREEAATNSLPKDKELRAYSSDAPVNQERPLLVNTVPEAGDWVWLPRTSGRPSDRVVKDGQGQVVERKRAMDMNEAGKFRRGTRGRFGDAVPIEREVVEQTQAFLNRDRLYKQQRSRVSGAKGGRKRGREKTKVDFRMVAAVRAELEDCKHRQFASSQQKLDWIIAGLQIKFGARRPSYRTLRRYINRAKSKN
jgi:hypothetical protein